MSNMDANVGMDFRQEIEDKIHKLTQLITENDKDVENETYLIHEDFITAMEALAHVQEHGYISDETMVNLNNLYKKHKKEYEENKNSSESSE